MNQQPTTEKPKPPFIAINRTNGMGIVMRGREFICRAVSHSFAKRIAAALNDYRPNKKGV